MKMPSDDWIRRMAELEDDLPISAGGAPFRQLQPPCEDKELQLAMAMAELEDGCCVSAGGAPFRVFIPGVRENLAEKVPANGQPVIPASDPLAQSDKTPSHH
jgi:hypothetical protein